MKTTTTKPKIGNGYKPALGDRIIYLGRIKGTITKISKRLMKYEITWDGGRAEGYTQKEFNRLDIEICSTNSTSAQALAPASHSQQLSLEVSTSSDCVSVTNGVSQSSSLDTQELKSPPTLQGLQLVIPIPEFTSLQPVPLANPFRSKGSAKEPTINVIVSPTCVKRSPCVSPSSSPLKTYLDSLTVPGVQDTDEEHTFTTFSVTFPASGSIVNGVRFPADTLGDPSADPDCFWLESPGALSSGNSRAPGQSRLESSLKANGLLNKGECLNPAFLEKSFHLPSGWTNPTELRPVTELLGSKEQPLATVLTPELPPSHFKESSISIPSDKKRKRSQNIKPASGSISACTTIKKGKPYTSYQYSYDVRDPSTKRGWRAAKVGVPRHKKQAIANLINEGKPVAEILEVLKK